MLASAWVHEYTKHLCRTTCSYEHVLLNILYFKMTSTSIQSQGLVLPDFPSKIKVRCLHSPSNYIMEGFIGTEFSWKLEASRKDGDMGTLHRLSL